jgi:hypothetical protein
MRGVQFYIKQLPLDYFVIQTNLQSRHEYFYSNFLFMTLSLPLVFMFTELRRYDKLYVIFQVFRSCYTMWRNTTSAWGATAISRNTENHIRVASSTQRHMTALIQHNSWRHTDHLCYCQNITCVTAEQGTEWVSDVDLLSDCQLALCLLTMMVTIITIHCKLPLLSAASFRSKISV